MKVSGARVLLTGATGGIGHALARALHEGGAQLLLTGRRLDVLTPLADELGARAIPADLSVRDDVERLAVEAADVDILIANAALPASGHLLDLSQAQIDTMLEVNLRAPIALARALAPAMVPRGRGHIVFISSLSGKAASPAASVYSAAKFGLRGFAHGARADLRGAGVGVSVILPGFVRDAGMFADTGVKLPPGVGNQLTRAGGERRHHRDRAQPHGAERSRHLGCGSAPTWPRWRRACRPSGSAWPGGAHVARRVSARQAGKRPDDRP